MTKRILVLALPLLMVACSSDEEKKPEPIPDAPLAQSKNNETFNKAYQTLLNNYYALQAGFVKEDTVAITKSAKALQLAADSLPLKELKADTLIIQNAQSYAQNVSDEVKGLLGEKDLENKRKSFETISNHIQTLTTAVKYDRQKLYLIQCPMAFNNKGAIWLSNNATVINPYLPKEMPNCGEVKDSIDFVGK